MSCIHAHDDAAYLLGALPPAERQRFEEHLPGCPACTEAVRRLAGLPGLLARVEPGALADEPPPPVPASVLPALLAHVRRRRRRRVLAGSLAAAAAAVAALVVVPGLVDDEPGRGQARAMTVVDHAALRGRLAVSSSAEGTSLRLWCAGGAYDDGDRYELVVRTRGGAVEQVASWRAHPGHTTVLAATTSYARDELAAAEVRDDAGRVVLRLPVSR